jgi:hypothetical protein
MNRDGLPHSEIPGLKVVCTYPRLIAAYHVLHRLLVPRHPPYALSSLTKHLRHMADDRLLWKSIVFFVSQNVKELHMPNNSGGIEPPVS